MVLISISNDKNANWTKFEQNPFKIKRFQFFVAETPDSRRTFFKIALRPFRVVQSSFFFIQTLGWSQIFRIYKEIENQTTLNKVMAPGNWCKNFFKIIFAQNAKKPLFHANFNEIWLTNHVFNVSQSLFWFCICTWLCFLHFQKIFTKIAINWVFTVRFKKFKSL